MKKLAFATFMLLTASVAQAQVTGTMRLDNSDCSYDTLEFRNIGPGMTYTKVYFPQIGRSAYEMTVSYVKIDMTNPYNSHTSYIAQDQFYTAHSQLDEYEWRKKQGTKAVATVMGGAFVQINSNDELKPSWEVAGGLVSDGRLLLNPSGSCYYVTDGGKACVGNVSLTAQAVRADGTRIAISNINRYRGRSSGVTLYCNNYGQSRDAKADAGAGTEILLSLTDAGKVGTYGNYKCKVENVYTGTNHSFSPNQIILSANGDAEKLLAGITAGEELTLTVSCTDATGSALSIMQSSTPLFGYGVKSGVAQSTGKAGYAQCAFGVSQDGNTSYWFLLEQSENSDAPVSLLNEFMAQVGAWDALLMDGGPSAEMTVLGEWTAPNSIGAGFNGRNVPCGLVAYSTAPSDNTLASVDFKEIKVEVNKGSSYTPGLYGFNRYGELISSNVGSNSAVYLTCDESVGTISADGWSFTPTTGKSGYIYAHVKGSSATSKMWINVRTVATIKVEPESLFTEDGRGLNASVYVIGTDGTKTQIDAGDANWTATNKWVCDVDKDGYLYPGQDNDGSEALVIAEYLGQKDTITVTVENVEEDYVNYAAQMESPDDINLRLPGVPSSFTVKLKSNGAVSALLKYTAGSSVKEEIFEDLKPGETTVHTVTLPYSDIDAYPVTINSISSPGQDGVSVEQFMVYYHNKTEAETVSAIHVQPKTFFTASGRGRQASVTLERTDKTVETLNPSAVEWKSDNNAICSVSDEGYLSPDMDGEICVTASYLGFSDAIDITVQNPKDDEHSLKDEVKDISDMNIVLPSIPTSFFVQTLTDTEEGADITIIYKKGETRCEEKLGFIDPGTTTCTTVQLDVDDFEAYPVTIEKIVADGAPVQLLALTALYHGAEPTPVTPPTGITSIDNADGIKVFRADANIMISIPDGVFAECRVLSLDGKQIMPEAGIYGAGNPTVICHTQATPLLILVNIEGKRYIYKIQ